MKNFDWKSVKKSNGFMLQMSIIESNWNEKIWSIPLPEKLVKILKLEGGDTAAFNIDEFIQASLLPEPGDAIYLFINLDQFTEEDQALIENFNDDDLYLNKLRYVVEVVKTSWVFNYNKTVRCVNIGVKLLDVYN